MGILGRLSTLIKSNVNDAIDSMQDPGKEIDQMVRDMEDYARQARAEVGRCIADERLLERRVQSIEAEIGDWEKRAETAIRAGDDTWPSRPWRARPRKRPSATRPRRPCRTRASTPTS